MASSIKTGLSNLSEKTEAFFICLGDMPMVNYEIYDQIVKFKDNKEITKDQRVRLQDIQEESSKTLQKT